MKQLAIGFLWLVLPFTALAQTTPAPDLVSQGDDKKAQGDLKGAMADYSQAIAEDTKEIALHPHNATAFCNRGNARAAKGDLSGAISDYTRAIALDPHHVRAFLNRGNVKNLEKKYGAAIDDYTAAIALDPKNAAAYYNRAGAERALGDYTVAAADFSKAITLNPDDVQAYLNRAILQIVRSDWDAAKDDLNKSIDLIPEERQAYGHIYLWINRVKQGETGKAGQELTQYLDHSPKTYETTWGWQIAKFLADQIDEAHFLASARSFQAKKNRGQVAQAHYYVGLKHKIAGDEAGAEKFFKECLEKGDASLHEFILAREEVKSSDNTHK